jgi:hypothetical protein
VANFRPAGRQVHLDFHTSAASGAVADDFVPEEFAQTLVDAGVDSVLLFARCHHGWMYYDSKLFPERRHPGLTRNLLQEQIDACAAVGIKTPIYTTVQWDNLTAEEHPEWRIVSADGRLEGTPPYEAGFYRKLCLNSPFRDFMFAQADELLDTFDVSGLYFDFIRPDDCSCVYCRSSMRELGIDEADETARRQFGVRVMNDFESEMSRRVLARRPDGGVTYNGGHIGLRHREVREAYSHFELETLPSGGWGYMYFPIAQRYARSLGRPTLGTTGMFHSTWGDYRSYKNIAALEYEVFRMLALGAGTCIGDQLEPSGRLDPAVYTLIGRVFRSVREKEPWCLDAQPVSDIAVLHPEEFLGGGVRDMPSSIEGVTRMLEELGHQFDIVDFAADLTPYRLVVLPDHIPTEGPNLAALQGYIAGGGAVIASFASGMDAARHRFELDELGVTVESEGPRDRSGELARGRSFDRNDFSNYLRPGPELSADLPGEVVVMPILGMDVAVSSPDGTVLADAVPTTFDRSYQHFASHLQAPPSTRESRPGIVQNGRTIYFSHPVFQQYEQTAPAWCRHLVGNAIERLLPGPAIRHDGPTTLRAAVLRQVDRDRLVVHLLHYIPERRGQAFDTIEDIIALSDVRVDVRSESAVRSVCLVPSGARLPFSQDGDRVIFVVPTLLGHAMICLDSGEPGVAVEG